MKVLATTARSTLGTRRVRERARLEPSLPFVGYADSLGRQPGGRFRVVDTKLARQIKVTAPLQLVSGPAAMVVAGAFLAGLVTAFLVYTLRPPAEPDVFIDPITGKYGLRGRPDAPLGPATDSTDYSASAPLTYPTIAFAWP